MPDAEHPSPRRLALLLAIVLIIAAPPLFLDRGIAMPSSWHEGMSLATAQETWQNQHAGQTDAWIVPTVNGIPRIVKPPMIVWMTMAAWMGLHPADTPSEVFLARARIVPAIVGLLMLAGIFWIGVTVLDAETGAVATLLASGLIIAFQKYARMVSYDICLISFSTLSVAGALWAIAPFSATPSSTRRRLVGMAVCAMSLAAAYLSKGPLSVLLVAVGAAPFIVLGSRRRMADVRDVVLAIVVAAVLVAPWYWLLWQELPNRLLHYLKDEYDGPNVDIRPFWHYFTQAKLTVPWTLWLGLGLVLPFLKSREPAAVDNDAQGGRSRRLPALVAWFGVVFLFFSLVPAKVERYILPAIAPGALLAGAAWVAIISSLRDPARNNGLATWIVRLHWLVLVAASIGAPISMAAGRQEEHSLHAPLPWPMVAVAMPALLAFALLGWRWSFHAPSRISATNAGHALPSAILAACWTGLMGCLYWHGSVRGYEPRTPSRVAAAHVTAVIGDNPCYSFGGSALRPDAPFLFYARRAFPRVKLDALDRKLEETPGDFFVITDQGDNEPLRERGLEPVLDFSVSTQTHRTLWRRPTPESD